MKGAQESVDTRLSAMKRENETLWREVASLRQKHMKQQQIVNKLIQFLISIVQPNGRSGLGIKRRYARAVRPSRFSEQLSPTVCFNHDRYPLMLGESSQSGEGRKSTAGPTISVLSPGGPIIHDVTELEDSDALEALVEIPLEAGVSQTSPQLVPSDPLAINVADELDNLPIYTETNNLPVVQLEEV